MYEGKVGKAYGRGCLLSCAVMVGGGILGTALVTTVLVIVRGGDVEPGSPRVALALAMPIFFMAAIVGAGAGWVALRGRRLDRAFAPWRLEGRQSGGSLRGWHGEIGGRAFDGWFHRGPTLELYLGCRPATRGVIHRGGRWIRALARAVDRREPLEPPPIDLEGASVYCDDPGWMRRLLARPRARAAVGELMTETRRVATAVFVLPDAVRYLRAFMPVAELTDENLRRWLASLESLAAEVDALGPSIDSAEATRLETWSRTARGKYMNRILAGLGLTMIVVLLALFVFGWLNVGRP